MISHDSPHPSGFKPALSCDCAPFTSPTQDRRDGGSVALPVPSSRGWCAAGSDAARRPVHRDRTPAPSPARSRQHGRSRAGPAAATQRSGTCCADKPTLSGRTPPLCAQRAIKVLTEAGARRDQAPVGGDMSASCCATGLEACRSHAGGNARNAEIRALLPADRGPLGGKAGLGFVTRR